MTTDSTSTDDADRRDASDRNDELGQVPGRTAFFDWYQQQPKRGVGAISGRAAMAGWKAAKDHESARWVPTRERLPSPQKQVLMYVDDGCMLGYLGADGHWYVADQLQSGDGDERCVKPGEDDGTTDYPEPTHWMHLPPPPESA